MIAIVILGLGLVMVATIFPVAWDRARTLSEYTMEQSAAAGAQTTLASLLRPASHSLIEIRSDDVPAPPPPPRVLNEELRLTGGSLAGDMFFDPTLAGPPTLPLDRYLAILAFSDTSMHALNMENILFISTLPTVATVAENPWDLEDPGNPPGTPTQIVQDRFLITANYPNAINPRNKGKPFPDRLFYGGDNCMTPQGGTPQVRAWQRLYPPMTAPPADPAAPGYSDQLNQWNEKLATRRFCWAVLHRLRSQVGPRPLASGAPVLLADSERMVREAAAAMGTTRTFDMYYVTLRRSKPTNRYARQDPTAALIPNPFVFDPDAEQVQPAALAAARDVMFPVAWRVQMEFPLLPPLQPAATRTGIPTEVTVPPANINGETARMLVQMFPAGTQFIDEITGNIYRVAKRRIVDNVGEQSVLTLDREIVVEDLDLPPGDPRCPACLPDVIEYVERLRTVWVFPPPVDRSQPGDVPTFDGPSPVVGIEVGSLSISPSS